MGEKQVFYLCDMQPPHFSLHLHSRITSRLPDDPRQPFWNETGAPMKPLAKLTVNRQRLYRKSCNDDDTAVPFSEAAETDFYDEKPDTNVPDQNTDQGERSGLS